MCIFNLVSEHIFTSAAEKLPDLKIKINEIPLTTKKYAAQTVILSNFIVFFNIKFLKIKSRSEVAHKLRLNCHSNRLKGDVAMDTE